jgi:hypothetical protein
MKQKNPCETKRAAPKQAKEAKEAIPITWMAKRFVGEPTREKAVPMMREAKRKDNNT